MAITPIITMTETPRGADEASHGRSTRSLNEAQIGHPEDYRRLAILASHPDTG
jgi:hypothetical protein